MTILAAADATPVAIPTLAIPWWAWVAVLIVIALLAVGLGFEAVRGGHTTLMIISLVVGVALGSGIVGLVFTNLLRGESTAALQELESRYGVFIHPQRDGMFAVPVVRNSYSDVFVRTKNGAPLDCMIVSDEETYSLFCRDGGTLKPIEALLGEGA